jgi:hypothetical protein
VATGGFFAAGLLRAVWASAESPAPNAAHNKNTPNCLDKTLTKHSRWTFLLPEMISRNCIAPAEHLILGSL